MTIKKSSVENNTSPLRTPKAKNKLGLQIRNVPNIRMPHEDLIVSENTNLKSVEDKHTGEPNKSSMTSLSRQTSHTRQTDISPTKNFQKIPNSVTKEAIPSGLFKPGKSKHLWDVLYSLTRGSINPTRSIRMSKTKLMKKAAIGSRITFDSCIEHLSSVGLLKIQVFTGEHQGNEFEVLLPEEILTMTSVPSQTSMTSPAQNLDRLVILESRQTSHSLNTTEIETSDFPKTLFKTNTNDDEAFAKMVDKLTQAVTRLTGRKPSKTEAEKWGELADLLILELEVAASRAGTVSSVPAFLTEVLRRQFFVARREQKSPSAKPSFKPDTIGKSESETFEIKLLDEQGRELALEQLREFAAESFLKDFKKWYTEDDWQWLTEKLKTNVSD